MYKKQKHLNKIYYIQKCNRYIKMYVTITKITRDNWTMDLL